VRNQPTAEERNFYRDNGFLSVQHFLDDDELATWREVLEGALEARGAQRFSYAPDEVVEAQVASGSRRSRFKIDDQKYYDRIFTQRINLWQTDQAFRELLFQPDLHRFVGELAGVEGLRIWHDQTLIKEPYGNPTAFHLDVPYWSFTSPDAITIWVALDDATLQNGCLYYVPGSHKAQKFENIAIGRELGALFDVYSEWRDVGAVPCPVPAGGAVLHNGLTFHGAGANMTPGRRRAVTCAYMPDGATFNGQANVLPPEYLSTLSIGDVLCNEEQNPLVYRRTVSAAR
jgi:ectoine hydroxylase-related dioxygenase (phytanoyl-CoA dioxygenase family)